MASSCLFVDRHRRTMQLDIRNKFLIVSPSDFLLSVFTRFVHLVFRPDVWMYSVRLSGNTDNHLSAGVHTWLWSRDCSRSTGAHSHIARQPQHQTSTTTTTLTTTLAKYRQQHWIRYGQIHKAQIWTTISKYEAELAESCVRDFILSAGRVSGL